MVQLTPEPGELRATIHIKRKETGKVEMYEIVGHKDPEKLKEILANHRANASTTPQEKQP